MKYCPLFFSLSLSLSLSDVRFYRIEPFYSSVYFTECIFLKIRISFLLSSNLIELSNRLNFVSLQDEHKVIFKD